MVRSVLNNRKRKLFFAQSRANQMEEGIRYTNMESVWTEVPALCYNSSNLNQLYGGVLYVLKGSA